jgi:hypothetical protein
VGDRDYLTLCIQWSWRGEGQLDVGTGLQTRHGCKYGIRVLADLSPISGEQHEDGETATVKILLVGEIPVCGDDGVEPFSLSHIE